MEVKLVTVNGKNAGQEVPVGGPRFFIGRAEDCQLRPRSDLVSRHHAVILIEEAFVAVRDFGSKNGTFVNGQRVIGETELKSGDHLRIGTMEFEVRIGGGVEAKPKKKPKVHSIQEAATRTVQTAESTKADDDVNGWLDDDEGGMSQTATMDPTKAIEVLKASKANEPAKADEEKEDEPVDDGEDVDDEPADRKRPSSAFQIPGRGKQASASSKDAAANMLKNFFRR